MRGLLAFLCLLYAVPVFAQTNPVPAGQPFTVGWTHDGLNVTSFTCSIDGKPFTATIPATGRQCVLPGQTAGTHTVVITAVNTTSFGTASTASAPLAVTAGTVPVPSAPTNLTITVQVAVTASGDPVLLSASVGKATAP